MRRLIVLALLLMLSAWARPAHAQLFGRKAKTNPAQRVPELIVTLKTAPEERKRVRAAEELRDFDARTYSEIVPVLIDSLKNDPKPAVRLEALSTLGKVRPISQSAGQAIEKAAAGDESWRIRLHARSVLVGYRLAGYSSKTGAEKGTVTAMPTSLPRPRRVTTAEPPLADPPARTTEPPLLNVPQSAEPPVGGLAPPAVPFQPPGTGAPALLVPSAPSGPVLMAPGAAVVGPTLPPR